MGKLWTYLIFLGWMSYLMIAGILLFTSGFFLTRISRFERAECTPCKDTNDCNVERIFEDPDIAAAMCLRPRAKVILLVVDALKYEFVDWYEDDVAATSYYRNKLPIVNELLQKNPSYTRLYKFMADPPTTTMQRLKGLTTGTLPTFVDIGSNFATEEITEDNLIDQNAENGVVFMGDDTWTNLFPGRFLRQYPVPSFNVWDLDTVDREVKNRILSEMKRKDWSLLVAHILGVDHCGHKHGPNHSEMTRKLNETNRLIKEISENLEEGTMLFVIGDHGMTKTGDHGGDSLDEMEAAMFVYSTISLLDKTFVESSNVANHVDLVPTLASILGTPIPYSNIGTVILDSLPSIAKGNVTLDDLQYALHSLWRNVVQTKRYIDTCSMDTFLFSKDKLEILKQVYNRVCEQVKFVNNTKRIDSFVRYSKVYSKLLRDMCTEVWVQFDSNLMSRGLILMFCALFFSYAIVDGIPRDHISKTFDFPFLRYSVLANVGTAIAALSLFWLEIIDEFKNTTFFVTGATSILLLILLVVQNWEVISTNWYNGSKNQWLNHCSKTILLLTVCGLFSNSYIVEEDRVLSFLLVTLIWLLLSSIRMNDSSESSERRSKGYAKPTKWLTLKTILIIMGLIASVSIRFSSYFWRCREEQQQRTCATFVLGKAGSIVSDSLERVLLTTAVVVLALYITIIRIWLQNCGNLSGFSPSTIIARYCPGIIVVCMGCFWVLQRLPKNAKVKFALSWQVNALPGVTYFFILLAIFILYCRPLSVYVLPKKSESISIYHGEDVVPRLFERMKGLIYRRKSDEEIPVVYGLGTVYSATFISLSVFLTLLYTLLLGDTLATSTVVMYVTCSLVLGITAIERFRNANSIAELLDVSNPSLLCWFLIAEYFFYGTGHQPTFPTIHWDAAFIGTGGHFYGNLLPAILIGINTFGSHIILGITLPLLIVAPFTLYLMFPNLIGVKFHAEDDMKRGELLLFERGAAFQSAIFKASGKYLLYHGIRTFGCMLAATIHSRHLMIWKIFAPKLIFEGLGFMVTAGSVLASFFMMIRIDRQVEHLITRLTKVR